MLSFSEILVSLTVKPQSDIFELLFYKSFTLCINQTKSNLYGFY